MDAVELQLRKRISALEEQVEKLNEELLDEYAFNERIRRYLVNAGLIEGAAEDE